MFDPFDALDITRRMPLFTRILLWFFGRRLNRDLFSPVLCRAHERQEISSRQLHALAHHFDPTQRGTVGVARDRLGLKVGLKIAGLSILLFAAPAAAQTITITDPATQGTFRWDASTGADRYEIDLGRGQGYQSMGLLSTLKLAADTPDGTYTARLRACSASAVVACSQPATLTFIVDRPDPTPPTPGNFRMTIDVIAGVAIIRSQEPLPPQD